ncbi:DUF5686 family protein [Flavobacterium psychrotolerans]|uniref:Carboxypeptidase-like regulatory domain-containing protein n=1 Tax=Flavobacterium psychrotolerans TaxID=2169410 RepID=A0A2U1JNG0_9FLAO|nr:DUF5686 family protein [Flavobacterium psychrotolerans]PWA06535.1 hypothetical protein DB895_03720 [Flavobacterium psychrotolerans]
MRQFTLLFFFFSFVSHAQFRLNGIATDALTKKPLPFASISTENNTIGISDIDGKFSLELKEIPSVFWVSYIDYNKTEIAVNPNKKFYLIALSPRTNLINQVNIVPKENPALAIMRNVIENKNKNNPQKKGSSFQFNAYNKIIITANPDSIKGSIDSVFIRKKSKIKFSKIDSSDYKFKKIIRKQHLFQIEKVSQYQFNNRGLKETILGTKMSGFKQPIYEILGLSLQSFSVYDNRYELFETKYRSPISNNSLTDYDYKLLDSTNIQNRKMYVIYFKNNLKATGLAGLLFIDQNNFAVAKAIMRAKGVLDITGIHEFDYLEKEKLWFPKRKIFKIAKGKSNEDIRILGETFKFDADENDNSASRKKGASDYTYLLSETNFSELSYNIPVKIKHHSVAIEIKEDAIIKKESFWEKYRKDTLDIRSPKTYSVLDSIMSKKRIEKKLFIGRKILTGYIPLGPIDIDSRYFLSYNNYEGFRLGLGGKTSEKFSKIFKIEGYSAYGTKDGTFKYNLGFATRIGKFSDSWIGSSYTDDVREIASTSFAIDKRVFKLYDPRPINVSTFYNYQNWRGYIETKIIPKTESIWQLTHSNIEPKFNYVYNLNDQLYTIYSITTAMVSLQWNPFSEYMQTPNGRLEVEKRFPKFTIQYTKTLPKFIDNDFAFGKIDFRAEYEKKHLNGQKTALLLSTGYAYGDIPVTHLYNTSPNNLTKDRVMQRITLGGNNSFETMYFNEFFSSEYLSLQIKHGFKRVVLLKKIKPSLVLVSRMAWGNLQKPEQHVGIDYKTLDKGYIESGIELNQIFNGLGLSGFYRYGPNQLKRFEDNLAIKLTFVLNLGI